MIETGHCRHLLELSLNTLVAKFLNRFALETSIRVVFEKGSFRISLLLRWQCVSNLWSPLDTAVSIRVCTKVRHSILGNVFRS